MAASLVSYDFFNANSIIRPPNGPWVSDLSFDSSRNSILSSPVVNGVTHTLDFTGGVAARVGAGSLGVAGQTMGLYVLYYSKKQILNLGSSYSWTGCLVQYTNLYSPVRPGNHTVVESIGGNFFSVDIVFCGESSGPSTVERSGTLVLDSDASMTIRMYNQNVVTEDNTTVWMSLYKIALTLTPGARPPSTSPNSPNGASPSGSPLSSPASSSPGTPVGSPDLSGTTTIGASPSGVTIIAGVGSAQNTSSSSNKTNTSTIIGASLAVVAGILLAIALGLFMIHRRRKCNVSRGIDFEGRRSNPGRSRVKDELQPRPFADPTPLTTTANVFSPQVVEQPSQEVIEGLTRKRPPHLVEDLARSPEEPGLAWPRDFKNPTFDSAWKVQEALTPRPRVKG